VDILVIDVGGTHVKLLATGQTQSREVASGRSMTAAQMVDAVKQLTRDWHYDRISIGFPGPVVHGRILHEPHNLGTGWVGFDFERAFGMPVRLINDAEMQALGGFALWTTPGVSAKRSDAVRTAMPVPHSTVVLFDVDNTLLDNDRIIAELQSYLQSEVGVEQARCYFEIFEALRAEQGYADYLGALQRYRVKNPHEPGLLAVSEFMVNYRFANRLFPGALDVIDHLGQLGPTVILTDGDVVFQPRKMERSGLLAAVGGRALVCIHKELELSAVEQRFPADHYVLVDDKIRILSAIKQSWGARVTTVWPKQGHYAKSSDVANYPKPDVEVERIGDLLELDLVSRAR
jgi:ROK family